MKVVRGEYPLALILMPFMLAACGEHVPKAKASKASSPQMDMAGTWSSQAVLPDGSHLNGIFTIQPDGSYIGQNILSHSKDDRVVLIEGSFEVMDGCMIESVTKNVNLTRRGNFTNMPPVPLRSTNEIVRFNQDEMVVRYRPQGFQAVFQKVVK